MTHTERWSVKLYIDEDNGQTVATARLHTGDNELIAHGHARRYPTDPDVPEIGKELAVARALQILAHMLFDATLADIEAVTHRPATLVP